MKKLLLIIGLMGCLQTLSAQSFFHSLRLELPEAETKVGIPIKDKSLLNLPYGMNGFLYPAQPQFSFLWTSFRWIALFYKDKFGLEFYSDGFYTSTSPDKFNRYLADRNPDYYLKSGYLISNLEFGGQALGIAYRLHWRSFILEPKFLLGFESLRNDSTLFNAYLKEKGSNQFLQYFIGRQELTPHQHSYQGRLLIGKRWKPHTNPTEYEIGCQLEYIYSPYTEQWTITQRSFDQPPVQNQLTVRTSARLVNIGAYFKVYLHRWVY